MTVAAKAMVTLEFRDLVLRGPSGEPVLDKNGEPVVHRDILVVTDPRTGDEFMVLPKAW